MRLENDPRAVDLGALPSQDYPYRKSELGRIFIRPFTVNELYMVHMFYTTQDLSYLLRAVQLVVSCPIYRLTDGDFLYILAWLRDRSYPKTPMLTRWTCTALNWFYIQKEKEKDGIPLKGVVVQDKSDQEIKELAKEKKIERRLCSWHNTELIYTSKISVISLEEKPDIHPYLDFPRVATLKDYYEKIIRPRRSKTEKIALIPRAERIMLDYARWIKEGSTLEEKLDILNSQPDLELVELIRQYKKQYFHGFLSISSLRCNCCDARFKHTSEPEIHEVLADNTEQSILEMQYTLAAAFNIPPDDNMPSKKLLFFYSKLSKELKEDAEKAKLAKQLTKRNR